MQVLVLAPCCSWLIAAAERGGKRADRGQVMPAASMLLGGASRDVLAASMLCQIVWAGFATYGWGTSFSIERLMGGGSSYCGEINMLGECVSAKSCMHLGNAHL